LLVDVTPKAPDSNIIGRAQGNTWVREVPEITFPIWGFRRVPISKQRVRPAQIARKYRRSLGRIV
jgi:hypothetical protein